MIVVAVRRVFAGLLVGVLALINVAPCLCDEPATQSAHCVTTPSTPSVMTHHCSVMPPEPARFAAGVDHCCCAGTEQERPLAESLVPVAPAAPTLIAVGVPSVSDVGRALLSTLNVAAPPAQSPPLVLRI